MVKLALDHIAVLAETLAEAVGHVEAALARPMEPGGAHERFGTHNHLIGLNPDLYIEAIAVDPSAPALPDARWFGLDHFKGAPRLDKWVCTVDDIEAAVAALPMAGQPVQLTRGSLSWTMAVPKDGLLPFDGIFPALIQWHVPVPPGKALTADDAELLSLTVSHPEAELLQTILAPYLDDALVSFKPGAAGLVARIRHAEQDILLA
ncbi:VOC family protein [Sagittula sp. NFXS13]|uniref:VOC family protein n=1 Tax=Sagittula sp. NFXS13 TaxID=2819095 RepID=UPI0032DE75A4